MFQYLLRLLVIEDFVDEGIGISNVDLAVQVDLAQRRIDAHNVGEFSPPHMCFTALKTYYLPHSGHAKARPYILLLLRQGAFCWTP